LRVSASTWDDRAIFLGDSRGDLPEAAREVRELAAAMGVAANVGSGASRQVLASARGARSLHVATHGTTVSSVRAIMLADGDLTAADVLDAGLDPQFVVLSGCATAASDDAESWDGFPSAFLAAGSRYVVATLRSVDDAAAARVTKAYYAQPATMDPLERLAAAQRQVSAVLPVAAWASFAAWGSAACEGEHACSFRNERRLRSRMRSSDVHVLQRAVLRARSLVGHGRYIAGAGGRDPSARTPDSVVRGRCGCDDAGFLAWCLGYDRHQTGFTAGSDWINADSMICESETRDMWFRPLIAPELGAVIAYCSIDLEHDGQRTRAGHAGLVVAVPERWSTSESAWAALRVIHCSQSIQRRRGHAIDETHAAAWAHRASFHGTSHPRWRTRFLRYLCGESV
jgi:hypothetical protein